MCVRGCVFVGVCSWVCVRGCVFVGVYTHKGQLCVDILFNHVGTEWHHKYTSCVDIVFNL